MSTTAAAQTYTSSSASASDPPTTADKDKDIWTLASPTFNSKRNSEYFDPCQSFADKSIKCMHRNAGDKAMCQDYFQAYRDCKKEWTARRKEERRKATEGKGWLG